MTAAMAAWRTTWSARTHTRAEGPRHHRTAGPTGAHPRWQWSTREDEHPLGTFGTARTKHAVVRAERVITPGNGGAGEEDNRHDENRAGDDHHPRRSLVEPRRLRHGRRCVWRWRRAGVRRLELGLGCLGHPSIMPTRAPAIKRRADGVADPLSAATRNRGDPATGLVAQEPGETQNDHGDEHDSRNDRHPGRGLINPLGVWLWRQDGRRRDRRRRNRRRGCLAHAS